MSDKLADRDFNRLIKKVNEVYPDGLIDAAAKYGDECGDTLALFIYREIKDVYDEDAAYGPRLHEISEALRRAREELEDVIQAIDHSNRRYLRTFEDVDITKG